MKENPNFDEAMRLLAALPDLRKMHGRCTAARAKVREIESLLHEALQHPDIYEPLAGDLEIDLRTIPKLSSPRVLGKLLNRAHEESDRFLAADSETYHNGNTWQIRLTVYRKLLERLCSIMAERPDGGVTDSFSCQETRFRQINLSVLRDYQSLGLKEVPPIKIKNSKTGAFKVLESIPIDAEVGEETLSKYTEQTTVLHTITSQKAATKVRDVFETYARWLNDHLGFDVRLPLKGETVAISRKPKTTALCYDRLWSPLNDVVPEPVRCWGGTVGEHLALSGLVSMYDKLLTREESDGRARPHTRCPFEQSLYDHVAPMLKSGPYELELAGTPKSEAEFVDGFELSMRAIAESFARTHGSAMVPVFGSAQERDRVYTHGDRTAVLSALMDLQLADEESLPWDQVLTFRADNESRRKYRRLLHWLDGSMLGKSQPFIEDEISQRLEDYERALKKHGIKTVIGTIEEALDGKYILGAGAFALVGHPILAVLATGLLVAGKIAVKLLRTSRAYDDVERGVNSEISWVHEVKGLAT